MLEFITGTLPYSVFALQWNALTPYMSPAFRTPRRAPHRLNPIATRGKRLIQQRVIQRAAIIFPRPLCWIHSRPCYAKGLMLVLASLDFRHVCSRFLDRSPRITREQNNLLNTLVLEYFTCSFWLFSMCN